MVSISNLTAAATYLQFILVKDAQEVVWNEVVETCSMGMGHEPARVFT